mgnify:CR=1 FL=1
MNCSRCRGLMTKDYFMDFEGTAGHMWMAGFRCLNCGHIYDPVIERNRQMPQPVMHAVSEEQAIEQHEDVLEEVYLEAESYFDQAA